MFDISAPTARRICLKHFCAEGIAVVFLTEEGGQEVGVLEVSRQDLSSEDLGFGIGLLPEDRFLFEPGRFTRR